MKAVVHTDGGARGNPGPAGIGVVVAVNNTVAHEHAGFMGTATNNEAEYQAVVTALEWLLKNHSSQNITEVEFYLDSKLVVEQLSKRWKIKEPRLLVFATRCWQMLSELQLPHTIKHVVRSANTQADALVNQALDAHE